MNVREMNDLEIDKLAENLQFERMRRRNGVGEVPFFGADHQVAGAERRADNAKALAGQNTIARPVGLTLESVDDCFAHHAPNGYTLDAMNQVRETALLAAHTILRVVPDCPDRSTALRKLREARMWANSALALGGRF